MDEENFESIKNAMTGTEHQYCEGEVIDLLYYADEFGANAEATWGMLKTALDFVTENTIGLPKNLAGKSMWDMIHALFI